MVLRVLVQSIYGLVLSSREIFLSMTIFWYYYIGLGVLKTPSYLTSCFLRSNGKRAVWNWGRDWASRRDLWKKVSLRARAERSCTTRSNSFWKLIVMLLTYSRLQFLIMRAMDVLSAIFSVDSLQTFTLKMLNGHLNIWSFNRYMHHPRFSAYSSFNLHIQLSTFQFVHLCTFTSISSLLAIPFCTIRQWWILFYARKAQHAVPQVT